MNDYQDIFKSIWIESEMDSRSVLKEDDPDKGFLRGSGPEVLRAIWDKEVDVPEKTIQFVDDNVRAKLPDDAIVKDIYPHGASFWTRTAEIRTETADGTATSFFLKVTQHDTGKGTVSGEFVSMSFLHEALPELTPEPIAWGTYASDPNVHFFLCEFVDMTDDIPELDTFPAKLARLHRYTVSPNGKYGFPVPTFQSCRPQETAWADTWEEFFTNSFKRIVAVEEAQQGFDEEMKSLTDAIVSKVIPRLLRPLETGGRSIQPCLVHGDLWDGNASTNTLTNEPVIFDATSLYAHNEFELAPWLPPRHRIGRPYIKAYCRAFPISAPEEDFDDRIALYCVRFDVNSSASYPGNLRFRRIVVKEMRRLVEKYSEGYEGWRSSHD